MKHSTIIGLVVVLFAGAVPAKGGREITVLVVLGRNGKPWKGRVVAAWPNQRGAPYLRPAPGSARYPGSHSGTTAKDGTARFILGSPEPPTIEVSVGTPDVVDYCSQDDDLIFNTKEVLRTGVVTPDTQLCDKSGKVRAKFKPKPGEIVIFVRKVHFWENW